MANLFVAHTGFAAATNRRHVTSALYHYIVKDSDWQ